MGSDWVAEKVVIVAGTTGVGLKRLYNCIREGRLSVEGDPCVYHFEDLLEEEYGGEGKCRDIEQLIALMLTSRPAASSVFKRGVERVRERLRSRGCRRAIIFAHLTYLSRRMIVANPVISELLGLAREASVIYLVDDFFDALYRIAVNAGQRMVEPGCSGLPATPYNIDPVLYLTWRATDSNILSIVDSIKPGTEIYVYGVKHPAREFEKLLSRVLKTRQEYLVDSKPATAYVSHPITQIRQLYVALGEARLRDIPLVKAIEAFKEALRRRDSDLILFEPTTIDELHVDGYGKILDYIRGLELKGILPVNVGGEGGFDEEAPFQHSLFVDSSNRWPFSEENLREYCSGEEIYPYSNGGRIGLLDAEMAVVYGTELYHNIQVDFAVNNVLLRDAASEGQAKGILATQLNDLINAQIEERDYAYVSQSDHTIAVTTGVLVDKRSAESYGLSEGIYIPWSTGMDAEIQRSRALAKPTVYYLLPICYTAISGDPGKLKRIAKVLGEGFKHCHVSVEACEGRGAFEAVRRCAARIQRGGLFATIGGGVRVCAVPVIVKGGETLEELVERYSKSLC